MDRDIGFSTIQALAIVLASIEADFFLDQGMWEPGNAL